MKKTVILITFLICTVFSAACSDSRSAIPQTNLEFSICDNVTDFDFSVYQQRFGLMGGREYYGTGYLPTTDEYGMQVDPDACVIYTVTSYPDYSSRKQHITRITITDPSVTVWGLTLLSTAEEVNAAMTENGFRLQEYPNSYGTKYAKGKISVHFTAECITISADVSNFWKIQF